MSHSGRCWRVLECAGIIFFGLASVGPVRGGQSATPLLRYTFNRPWLSSAAYVTGLEDVKPDPAFAEGLLIDLRRELLPSPFWEELGQVAFRVENCLYVPENAFDDFAEAEGLLPEERVQIRPQTGWCYVVVELAVKNCGLQQFAIKDVLDFRLEDAGANLPGWDIDQEAQGVLSDMLPPVMEMTVEPDHEVRGYAVFALPEGTKNLWYAGYCKIGGAPEKKYVGVSRRRIGEVPGDEPVQPHRSGYKVVIGSFDVKANALEYAEEARARGLCAWVQEAYWPEGMLVVLTKLTGEYREAFDHAYIARERGYADAFIIGRPVSSPPW